MNSLYDNFKSDIFTNLSELTNTLNSFKDNFADSPWAGHWVGVVLDNNDPEKLGRLKVNVFGVYDSITNLSSIPWAEPMEASLGGQSLIVPDKGSLVNIYFENDEIYLPRYTTKVPTNSVLKGNTKVDIESDYPNNMLLFENVNMSVQMNKVTGQTVFKHKSGMVIHFTGDKPNSTKDGKNSTANSFELLLSSGSKSYAIKANPDEGLYITDGKNGETIMQLGPDGLITETTKSIMNTAEKDIMNAAKGSIINDSKKTICNIAGTAGHVLDGTGLISTSPGLAVPDPSKMGPFNCIPVCPFSGAPHTGNKYMATGKPSGAVAAENKSIKSKADNSTNFTL